MSEEMEENFGFNEDYYDKLVEENQKLREVVKDFHEVLKYHLSKFQVNDELIYNAIEKHEQFLKELE